MIYIVMAVHDRRQLTRACLQALREQTEKGFQVVVVDDGSTDGTGEMLQDEFPEVVVLRGNGNLWWTGATNMGCAWALGRARAEDAVVTLNDDTLPAPEWLARLHAAAAAAPHALIGSLLVDSRSGLVSAEAGTQIDWWTAKFSHPWLGWQPDAVRAGGNDLLPIGVLCGCGTYVPARALRELGPFCPELPQYAADYEYSIRAARVGWDVFLSATAELVTYVELTGVHGSASKDYRRLLRSFWSVRSANAYRYRLRFARITCPRPALAAFIVCDALRVLVGSLLRFSGIRAA